MFVRCRTLGIRGGWQAMRGIVTPPVAVNPAQPARARRGRLSTPRRGATDPERTKPREADKPRKNSDQDAVNPRSASRRRKGDEARECPIGGRGSVRRGRLDAPVVRLGHAVPHTGQVHARTPQGVHAPALGCKGHGRPGQNTKNPEQTKRKTVELVAHITPFRVRGSAAGYKLQSGRRTFARLQPA